MPGFEPELAAWEAAVLTNWTTSAQGFLMAFTYFSLRDGGPDVGFYTPSR